MVGVALAVVPAIGTTLRKVPVGADWRRRSEKEPVNKSGKVGFLATMEALAYMSSLGAVLSAGAV